MTEIDREKGLESDSSSPDIFNPNAIDPINRYRSTVVNGRNDMDYKWVLNGIFAIGKVEVYTRAAALAGIPYRVLGTGMRDPRFKNQIIPEGDAYFEIEPRIDDQVIFNRYATLIGTQTEIFYKLGNKSVDLLNESKNS